MFGRRLLLLFILQFAMRKLLHYNIPIWSHKVNRHLYLMKYISLWPYLDRRVYSQIKVYKKIISEKYYREYIRLVHMIQSLLSFGLGWCRRLPSILVMEINTSSIKQKPTPGAWIRNYTHSIIRHVVIHPCHRFLHLRQVLPMICINEYSICVFWVNKQGIFEMPNYVIVYSL